MKGRYQGSSSFAPICPTFDNIQHSQRSALFLTYFLAYHIDQLSGKCGKDVSLYLLKVLIQIAPLLQDMKFYRNL